MTKIKVYKQKQVKKIIQANKVIEDDLFEAEQADLEELFSIEKTLRGVRAQLT